VKAKRYIIEVIVLALDDQEYPSVNGLVNGINDGLHDDWFTLQEGDPFRIVGFEYHEANNPLTTEVM
jgi:hypothetical protein